MCSLAFCDIRFTKTRLPSLVKMRFLDSLLNNKVVISTLQSIFLVELTQPR